MKTTRLLALHRNSNTKKSIKAILGDGYLLSKNFIYKNIRNYSERIGYKYVEGWIDYANNPLSELPKIIKEKKVPYKQTAVILEKIDAQNRNAFNVDEVISFLKSSHFHEAAHCIADHLTTSIKDRPLKKKVLKILLCESFANAVESFSTALAIDQNHQIFLTMNCYMPILKKVDQSKRLVIKKLGHETAFLFILYAYIYSNFLYKVFDVTMLIDLFDQIKPDLKLSSELKKHCIVWATDAVRLNNGFRLITTGYYFKSHRIKGDVFSILDFDFLQLIKRNPEFHQAALRMASVAITGQ